MSNPLEDLEQLFSRIDKSNKVERRLAAMTDAEVANMLDEHLLAHEDMFSARYELVSTAIGRLRRTGAGPLPVTEEADDE